jgi:chemotaxis protein MotB
MKKTVLLCLGALFVMSSCVSKKEFTSLENRHKKTQDLLNTATIKLNSCLEEKSSAETLVVTYKEQVGDLKRRNDQLFIQSKDYLELTSKSADNLEKSLESMQEKDLKITRLQDALTRKDSVTLAIVTSLKKEIGINDPDIEVNVEKGVVFISLSDKLLFKTGSYVVSDRAKEILAKVAVVVNGKPDFECMVEGHTDSRSYEGGVLQDNWDLSVKRATSIVRVLQELDVNPGRLIAAGRSYFDPLVDNETAENRAINRRTRIVIMPKIDQFYDMIEKEMKNLTSGS